MARTFGGTLDAVVTDTRGNTLAGINVHAWDAATGGDALGTTVSGVDGSFELTLDTTAPGVYVSAGTTGPRRYVPAREAVPDLITSLGTKANAATVGALTVRVDTTETRVGTVEDEVAGRLSDTALNSTYPTRKETAPARGAVMFSLDDNRAQNTELVALHEALGQRITLAIVSDWVGLPDRLTAAQLLAYHQRGHEIANHSKTHMNMTSGTPAARGGEYDACSDYIETLTGRRPETFVYPQGSWNATSDRELYTRFRSWALTCSAGTNAPVEYRLGETTPRFYRLDLDSPANYDRALEMVRLAAKAPVVVSFYTHWTDQPGTMTTAQYQSIAQLAADLNVPAVLPRDAFGSLSKFADPSFESPSTNVWMRSNTGAATATRTATAPDAGLSGAYVLALTATNPDTAGVGQAVHLTPGKWRFSGRIKQVSGGNLATNDFGVRLKYRDWAEGAVSQELFYPALPTVGTWGRFEQDFTVPEGVGFVFADLFITPGATRSGTLHVDHVDLRPTSQGGLG